MDKLWDGYIECPATECQDGEYRGAVEVADRAGVVRYEWGQCRACNGLGQIPDPTLRKVVAAYRMRLGGSYVVLDDGEVKEVTHGTSSVPGTLAHREAEDG